MKQYIPILAALLFCTTLSAQTNKISISGKLSNKGKISVIHLRNIDAVNIMIPVHAGNNFSFVTKDSLKGFYELDEIGTVYFSPGYQLTVQPNKTGNYVFNGRGALENNAIRTAKKLITTFLPVRNGGESRKVVYYFDESFIMQKLDSFQKKADLVFNKSKDPFFRKYAALDLSYYGWDSVLKPINRDELNWADREKLSKLMYTNLDKGNDTLFRNSVWYSNAFLVFFSSKWQDNKYISFNMMTREREMQLFKDYTKIQSMKLRNTMLNLAIARGEITNPYILSYFDFTLTSALLKNAEDSALLNKFYNEYIDRASPSKYLNKIKEIYTNRLSVVDNAPAPVFTYMAVSGKPVSLTSLHGKFVYIDVWATWCVPCKAEIPHLKKIEEAYQGKNIEFVSISVDEPSNLTNWKEFVRRNSLKGIQLISDNAFNSAFIEKMSINSIPRFILIDPNGKLISADAMRPSNEALKTLLDSLL